MEELIAEGDLRPPGKAVAARAEVSLRTVYHHFNDLDELLREVAARVFTRIDGLRDPVDPAWPLESRIERFVDLRVRTLESMVRFWRAGLLAADNSDEMRVWMHRGRDWLRAQVHEYFGPELANLPEIRVAMVVDAVHMAASAPGWDLLRKELGRGLHHARDVMRFAIRAAFEAAAVAEP